jgi:hypothetical protein
MTTGEGKTTTEFWVTTVAGILIAVLPVLVAYGVLTSELAEVWKGVILAIVAAVVPVVTGSLAKHYTNARTEIKVEALNLEREVVALESLRLEALGNE